MTPGKGWSISGYKHRLLNNGSTVGDGTPNIINACCMKALANRNCHLLSYLRMGTAPPLCLLPSSGTMGHNF